MRSLNQRPTAFVLVSTNHGTMLVNRHDYRIVGANGDGYGVGYQLLNHSGFDMQEVTCSLQLLQIRRQHYGDGLVAIDCGANIGVLTIEWAQLMHGWGQVIAIEAQERIFYALAGNISINNCFNAKAVWAAIGAETGSIRVPAPDYFVPSSFGSLEIRKSDKTEFIGQQIDYTEANMMLTPMISIDSMELTRLDLLKIDIEGMEMDALLGAEESINRHKPQLIIERIKSNEQEIRIFVGKLGYAVVPVGPNLIAIHTSDPTLQHVKLG